MFPRIEGPLRGVDGAAAGLVSVNGGPGFLGGEVGGVDARGDLNGDPLPCSSSAAGESDASFPTDSPVRTSALGGLAQKP